jgi:UDP-N-acetylmuramoylalanine--D-glutamate ligase
MTLDELKTKSILILGVGVEGRATYRFLRDQFPEKHLALADRRAMHEMVSGPEAFVELQNDNLLSIHAGAEYLGAIWDYEIVIKSPGFPWSHPKLQEFQARGGIVTTHCAIFLGQVDRKRVIGVTGTKGKSTTVSLITKFACDAGLPVVMGGNIGVPPLSLLQRATPETLFVLELSSYQLDRLTTSPHISVLLNIVPEHLGRHDSLAEYAHHRTFDDYVVAKENITRHQDSSDFLVFNDDYPAPKAIASRTRAQLMPFSMKSTLKSGCYVDRGTIVYGDAGNEHPIFDTNDIPLIGSFNQQNVLAAVLAGILIGVPASSMKESVRSFKPLPHRIEFVGEYQGVRFYDDSISTVPDATMNAVEALGADVQTLIAGGHDRNLEFATLAEHILRSGIRNVILFVPSGSRMWQAISNHPLFTHHSLHGFLVDSMEEAVRLAFLHTESGKICLLSPASPSYGLFKDFHHRGTAFKETIARFVAVQNS